MLKKIHELMVENIDNDLNLSILYSIYNIVLDKMNDDHYTLKFRILKDKDVSLETFLLIEQEIIESIAEIDDKIMISKISVYWNIIALKHRIEPVERKRENVFSLKRFMVKTLKLLRISKNR